MAIPDYQTIMLPLLQYAADGLEHASRDPVVPLIAQFGLSEPEQQEVLPSGRTVFADRVNWALTYLRVAGLLQRTRRGYFTIAPRGVEVLAARPARVDNRLLAQYPEFKEFLARNRRPPPAGSHGEQNGSIDVPRVIEDAVQQRRTPSELLEDAFQSIHQDLAEELLARLRVCSPGFFERLVVELLVQMG